MRVSFAFVLKLALATLVAFGVGYTLGRVVKSAHSIQVETTDRTSPNRLTTSAALWTCPVHPEVPLSKLCRCPKCLAGCAPTRQSSEKMSPEQVLAAGIKTATVEAAENPKTDKPLQAKHHTTQTGPEPAPP